MTTINKALPNKVKTKNTQEVISHYPASIDLQLHFPLVRLINHGNKRLSADVFSRPREHLDFLPSFYRFVPLIRCSSSCASLSHVLTASHKRNPVSFEVSRLTNKHIDSLRGFFSPMECQFSSVRGIYGI